LRLIFLFADTYRDEYKQKNIEVLPDVRTKNRVVQGESLRPWLFCQLFEDCFRRSVIQRLIQSLAIIKVEIPPRPAQRVRDPLIIRWPDFFIPGAPPAPFDEDVIERSSVAIQADPNPAGEQPVTEAGAGKLRALIGNENLRLPRSPAPVPAH
jgi:hypothetical protein